MRSGMVARKVGMSCLFDPESGVRTPVTLLQTKGCRVVSHKTAEKHGYVALQLGMDEVSAERCTKAMRGVFAKNDKIDVFFKTLHEFRVAKSALLDVGSVVLPSHFVAGACVDVTAISKGKGFQGPMKRHNFGGLRASHGVSISHRAHGSTGQRSFPGRVFKNKKMAGQMGAKRVTHQNLKVMYVDDEKGWVVLKGNVPGPKTGMVMVRDAVKKQAALKKVEG